MEPALFSFRSRGVRLAADVYLPESRRPVPVTVVGPGFAGVKEMLNPEYCRALAEEGIASVAFDYAGFGASDGDRRQHVDPRAQAQAYSDALDAVVADERFQSTRVGVWGPSLGGGHALVMAATHPAVRSAAAIVPFIRLPASAPSGRLAWAVTQDLAGKLFGRPDRMLPVTGSPGDVAAMTTDGAAAWADRMAAAAPSYRNQVTVASLLAMARWSTARAASRVRVPLRVVLAEDDAVTPPNLVRRALAGVPSVDYVTFPQTHFELFDLYGEQVRDSIVSWFRQTLVETL